MQVQLFFETRNGGKTLLVRAAELHPPNWQGDSREKEAHFSGASDFEIYLVGARLNPDADQQIAGALEEFTRRITANQSQNVKAEFPVELSAHELASLHLWPMQVLPDWDKRRRAKG